MFFCSLLQSVIAKFLQKRYSKFKKVSDKRKYKKDLFTGEKGNHGTAKQTQIPITVTEGLAATDKG